MRLVANTFDHLFRWIVEINFGQSASAPRWGWFQEENVQKDRADRDKILNEQGVRFSKDYYMRTYNLEDGDFEVGAPAPEQPGTAGAGWPGFVAWRRHAVAGPEKEGPAAHRSLENRAWWRTRPR